MNTIGCREDAAQKKDPVDYAVKSAIATVYVARAISESTTKHELLRAAVESSSLSLDITAAPNSTFGCHDPSPDPKCVEAAAHRATQRFLLRSEGVRATILIEHLNRVADDVRGYHDLVLLFGAEMDGECLAPANPDWSRFPFT